MVLGSIPNGIGVKTYTSQDDIFYSDHFGFRFEVYRNITGLFASVLLKWDRAIKLR
jgi:hypothetical protein